MRDKAVSTAFAGLATLGIFKFLRGYAGPGIWLAIVPEIGFAAAFWHLRHAGI